MSRPYFWLPFSLLIVLLSPRTAEASLVFPPTITTALMLSAPPGCPLCHTTDPGVMGTANRPFARKLRAYGLTPGDTAMLVTLLNKIRDAKEDTDEDGVTDIAEIK